MMTLRTRLLILLLTVCLLPVGAQQMDVEDYRHLKRTWLKRLLGKAVAVDKQQATLDLMTGEKGFTFKADGKTEVKAEEQDGMLTLMLPDKTRFLIIDHPDYGQHTWKAPEAKGLRKKKHYQAELHTSSPTKLFKPGKQWVVFNITPQNAIVKIDSITTLVRNGKAQFFLPQGTHPYVVESPFHEEKKGELFLTEDQQQQVDIELQPFYSYITVKVPAGKYYVYIDGQYVGRGTSTSGHLTPGEHQVTLRRGKVYFYEQRVTVKEAEKIVVEIPADKLIPRLLSQRRKDVLAGTPGVQKDTITVTQQAAIVPVTIKAPTDSTEIWVDRVRVGTGSWNGKLTLGFHAVNTQQDDKQSAPTYLFLKDTFPKTLSLMAPEEDYGMLNVHSNVIGAQVSINGQHVGQTPCLIENLPAGYKYKFILQKEGYREARQTVKARGNDLVDVNIKMKKN